jgi:hypothetical protein
MSARDFPRADLPIVVSSWEIECHGPLPTVGEPTTWRLAFIPVDQPDPLAAERTVGSVTELQWQVEPLADGSDGRALYRNGFAAYYRCLDRGPGGRARPLPPLGQQLLRGVIYGTRHGGAEHDTFPTTTATADRIQVISWQYRQLDRRLIKVPGSVVQRNVQQSPRRFTMTPRPRPNSEVVVGTLYRDDSSVLVTLRDDANPGAH